MNQTERNRIMDKLLPEILLNAQRAREANKIAVISGKRYTLPLSGRNMDIAYYPAKKDNAPLILGLHGGGFLFGGSALDDDLWRNVSEMLNVNIASVDYRLSPEVMDFDPLYDAYDSLVYLKDHSEDFGFDRDHISVFGSSAGGNLAAALCILAKQKGGDYMPERQILMYPFLDGATDPDEKGEGSFSGIFPHVMNRLHFSPEYVKNPLISPIYATKEDLKGLPKAIVSYCEKDNLRPEAVRYCEKLREAGVKVAEFYAKNMPHGYIESGFKTMFSVMDREFLGEDADYLINSGTLRETSVETVKFIKASW